jgi:hypothetical protein
MRVFIRRGDSYDFFSVLYGRMLTPLTLKGANNMLEHLRDALKSIGSSTFINDK